MGRGALSIVIALTLIAGAPLPAQEPPGFNRVPTIRGGRRDADAEAQRLAVLGSPAQVSIVRVPASIEQLFRSYRGRLSGVSGPPPDSVRPSDVGTTPVTYHVVYHAFEDECAEPGAGEPATNGAAPECRKWRRGKDKQKVLSGARIPDDLGWIETATFTWFRREAAGELVRMSVEIRDVGVAADWKRHTLMALLSVESVRVSEPAQDQKEAPVPHEEGTEP